MFDGGHEGVEIGAYGPDDDDRISGRRQYTLKGVEADTIRLMRVAASKEGMKIGSWVSSRMREAAERALSAKPIHHQQASFTADAALVKANDELRALVDLLQRQQENVDARFKILERELHEITSSQRTILSALVHKKLG